jgi:hypothetical protein
VAKAGDKSTPVVVWKVPGSREPQTPAERSLAEEWQRRGQNLRLTLIAWRGWLQGLSTPLTKPLAGEITPSPQQRRKAGAKPKYDWDTIRAFCYGRFGEDGYPNNVSEFCRDVVLPWCGDRYGEAGTPDMETLRPLVTTWVDAWMRSLPPK